MYPFLYVLVTTEPDLFRANRTISWSHDAVWYPLPWRPPQLRRKKGKIRPYSSNQRTNKSYIPFLIRLYINLCIIPVNWYCHYGRNASTECPRPLAGVMPLRIEEDWTLKYLNILKELYLTNDGCTNLPTSARYHAKYKMTNNENPTCCYCYQSKQSSAGHSHIQGNDFGYLSYSPHFRII